MLATAAAPFEMRERLMLGWAGLRGAVPIWLATLPVIAAVGSSDVIFNAVFFVVVTSTLVQGASFDPLARRLGLTTDEPALPQPVVETGTVRRLGGDSFIYVVRPDDAAAGALIRDLGLPREALVNLIVRGSTRDPAARLDPDRGRRRGPRAGAARGDPGGRGADRALADRARWASRRPPQLPIRGAPQVFTVRRRTADDGDPARPDALEGVAVAARLRVRRDEPGALVGLADGRYARHATASWSPSAAAGRWPTGSPAGCGGPSCRRSSAPGGRRWRAPSTRPRRARGRRPTWTRRRPRIYSAPAASAMRW